MVVLCGEAVAYLHAAGQQEWDSAAPVGVLRAAGFHASRIDGSELIYNQPDPYVPDFLICRPELAERPPGRHRRGHHGPLGVRLRSRRRAARPSARPPLSLTRSTGEVASRAPTVADHPHRGRPSGSRVRAKVHA